MTTAESAFTVDPIRAEGLEDSLVRLMARAEEFAWACFERAEKTEAPVARAVELRLACRLVTLITRTLTALDHRRHRLQRQTKAQAKAQQRARFDHALQMAKLADAAVAQKAKRDAVVARRDAPPKGDTPARPLSRQQRRAEERRRRKAERRAQGP